MGGFCRYCRRRRCALAERAAAGSASHWAEAVTWSNHSGMRCQHTQLLGNQLRQAVSLAHLSSRRTGSSNTPCAAHRMPEPTGQAPAQRKWLIPDL